MNRHLFYEQLGKKLKAKRIETITESALKECFRATMLD